MTRIVRTMVALAMAVLVLPVQAGEIDRSGAQELGWKLALQSWTIRTNVLDSLDHAKHIGVKYIEVYPNQPLTADKKAKFGPNMTEAQIKMILDAAENADVKIINSGVIGIPKNEAAARKLFAWAKRIGITTLNSEPDPAALPIIDKLAGEYGITVGIHNHPKPSRYWDPAYVHEVTKDLKNVAFCADLGHWKRSGLDPVDVLRKYGEHVVSMHFKDVVSGDGPHGYHDVVWGTGANQAAEVMKVLKAKGFQGPVAIEYEWKWDVPTLRKCVEFFHATTNKLAE